MSEGWIIYACLATGLSMALVAGVFQSFSDFVMRSLVAAEPGGGIESMQMINRKVYRSVFLTMFLVLAPVSIGFAVLAFQNLATDVAAPIALGATIYVVFVFLVTVLGNVPMNKKLDALNPFADAALDYWQTYSVKWTRLNTVRTWGSVAAAISFLQAGVAAA